MQLCTRFDTHLDLPSNYDIILNMAFEVATVLLGVAVGAGVLYYAARRGYFGRSRRVPTAEVAPDVPPYTQATEQVDAPKEVVPATAEPAPSPALPLYESVQPEVSPPPVAYSPSSPTTFGGPSVTRKPTRTYRRRTAPVRSTSPRAHRTSRTRKTAEQKTQ